MNYIKRQGEIRVWKLADLRPHPRPFTGISEIWVRDNIVRPGWDPAKSPPWMVNVPNGDNYGYIGDGNHRYTGAQLCGVTEFLCETFYGLSPIEFADLIHARGRQIRPYRELDDFGLKLEAGDMAALRIKQILDERGLTLVDRGGGSNPLQLGSIGTVQKIYAKYGSLILSETIDIVQNWTLGDNDRHKWNGTLLSGLASVIAEGEIDTARMSRKLSQVTPTWMMAKTREKYALGASSLLAAARIAIIERYKARGAPSGLGESG